MMVENASGRVWVFKSRACGYLDPMRDRRVAGLNWKKEPRYPASIGMGKEYGVVLPIGQDRYPEMLGVGY